MATTVTSRTAAWATTRATSTAPPAITIAIAASAAGSSLPRRTFWTRCARFYRRNNAIHAVEVRLIVRVELCAAFDHGRRCARRCFLRCTLR